MAIDVTEIQTFTDAQIVTILRKCLVDSAFALSYSLEGNPLSRANPEALQRLIEIYEKRVADSARGSGMKTLLAKFGNPR